MASYFCFEFWLCRMYVYLYKNTLQKIYFIAGSNLLNLSAILSNKFYYVPGFFANAIKLTLHTIPVSVLETDRDHACL